MGALYSQGQPNEVALTRIRETYWPALKMNWEVWTPLQYINVKYIPQMVSESKHKPVIYDRRKATVSGGSKMIFSGKVYPCILRTTCKGHCKL